MAMLQRVADAFVDHQSDRLLDVCREKRIVGRDSNGHRNPPLRGQSRTHLLQPRRDGAGLRQDPRRRPQVVDEQPEFALLGGKDLSSARSRSEAGPAASAIDFNSSRTPVSPCSTPSWRSLDTRMRSS
jgi:hypothetical protein